MLLTFYRFINNSGVDFCMIVDIKKLSVDYSGIKALDNLSFGIERRLFGNHWTERRRKVYAVQMHAWTAYAV